MWSVTAKSFWFISINTTQALGSSLLKQSGPIAQIGNIAQMGNAIPN